MNEILASVEVKRNNGQNSYGPWMDATSDDVPQWVGSLVLDEIFENDADAGYVEQGGNRWQWRKAE